jgi:hypothetical protein
MKISSIRKILIILLGHLWIVELNIYTFLPSSSLKGICSLILISLFAAGVVDTGGEFAAGVVDTSGNLPPVLLTPVATGINNTSETGDKICPTGVVDTGGNFAACVVDNGGKFATGVVDTGGQP